MRKLLVLILLIIASSILSFSQEVKNGFTQFFYPNGQVSSEGAMREGKPDGYWITYYTTGVLKSEGLRTNFFLDSTWTFYDQAGNVIQRINYKYGKKNGYSYTYSYKNSPDGVLLSKELYVNDQKEGKAYYYHENGNLKEEVGYDHNQKEGQAKSFDISGNLISILEYRKDFLISRERVNRTDNNGIKQGTWKLYYDDGQLNKEMFYRDNQLEGLYKEYFKDGTIAVIQKYEAGKIIEEKEDSLMQEELEVRREFDNGNMIFQGSYRDSIPVGIHRYYNSAGEVINSILYDEKGNKLSEGIITEGGSKEGNWKDFYRTGEVRAVGTYRNNQRSGNWIFYYENGKKEQEGNYLRGLPDGLWTWYYNNGNVRKEESYFNGREDGESIEYDLDGNIITKGNFLNGEKEGEWFYKVGDNTEKGNYQSGLRTGTWYSWYPENKLKFEGNFVQGQAQGKHKYYYPDGNLKEERYYEMGLRERNWKKYDPLGNIELTITYRNDTEYRINGEKINLPKGSVTIIR